MQKDDFTYPSTSTSSSDSTLLTSSSDDSDRQKKLSSKEKQQSSRESSKLTGTVKWFNAKNGYGFITRSDNGEDVFVHLSGISRPNPRHAFKSLCDGEIVEFNTMATNVTGIDGKPVIGNPYVGHYFYEYAGGDENSHRRRGIYRIPHQNIIPRWIGGSNRRSH